jgi:hypothetical protein
MKTSLLIIFIVLLYILLIGAYLYTRNIEEKRKFYLNQHKKSNSSGPSCELHTCGAIDPVSDPKYNMQQIIKQSILLEEHLTNKNKRCRDCIVKHFLHIIGLAEEAQMLATNKIDKYPLISECVILYNELFEEWNTNCKNDSKECVILDCCNKLRTMRKRLIVVYYFDEKYKINEKESNQ